MVEISKVRKKKTTLLPKECANWIAECFKDFENEGPVAELVFGIEVDDETLVVAIFNYAPEVYERGIADDLMTRFRDSFIKKYEKTKKDWSFNLRFLDRGVFLSRISRFDPDVLRFFSSDVQIILGKENYQNIKKSFIEENYSPQSDLVFLPFWEDTLMSWKNTSDRLIALDTQLSRTFFNGVKLFYALTADRSDLNLDNIGRLIDYKELERIFKSMKFIKDNPSTDFTKASLKNMVLKNAERDIQRKFNLIEEFIVQLTEWVIKWFEKHGTEYSLDTILNWLIIFDNYYQTMPGKDTYLDFAFQYLKSLELTVECGSEEHDKIVFTAKKMGLNGFK